MKTCNSCNSNRLLAISGKCADMCTVVYRSKEYYGYVPANFNIGSGDYLEFNLCVDCGKIQGKFPIDNETINKELNED